MYKKRSKIGSEHQSATFVRKELNNDQINIEQKSSCDDTKVFAQESDISKEAGSSVNENSGNRMSSDPIGIKAQIPNHNQIVEEN